MGTPDFAVASLRRLVEDGHEVVGVFTQPDKPKNRGMKLTFSPVKEYALTQDLPVYQPLKMRDGEALGILRELAPELIVVAAYGKILPQEILDLPQYGCINVHSSLLPKYRGAAPINWAILNGERVTGVSIMYMVAALDAGDVIRTVSTEIGEREDAAALTLRLSELGAQALSEARRTSRPSPMRPCSTARFRPSTGRGAHRRSTARCAVSFRGPVPRRAWTGKASRSTRPFPGK